MRKIHRPRSFSMLFLVILAVTFACNAPALKILGSVTSSPSPTTVPSPIPTATVVETATSPPLKPTAVPIDPCTLLTKPEAEIILGEAVGEPKVSGNACAYSEATTGVHVVTAYALQGEQAKGWVNGRVFLLSAFGVQFDQGTLDQIKALDAQGNNKAIVETLITLTQSNPLLISKSVEGLGDIALWIWKDLGNNIWQAFLVAVKGDVTTGVDLVIGPSKDEPAALEAAKGAISVILSRLPPVFIIPTMPTPIPSEIPPTPTLVPSLSSSAPEFGTPATSTGIFRYGGDCEPRQVTISMTVTDPEGVAYVNIFFRLVADLQGGRVTDWFALPMQPSVDNLWTITVHAEIDVPNFDRYPSAAFEYYFVAADTLGNIGKSPNYGLQSMPLTLISCTSP